MVLRTGTLPWHRWLTGRKDEVSVEAEGNPEKGKEKSRNSPMIFSYLATVKTFRHSAGSYWVERSWDWTVTQYANFPGCAPMSSRVTVSYNAGGQKVPSRK
ncbi:hypothetical protein VTK56DRAFT_1008 [Thermocarpiscus australiensis]